MDSASCLEQTTILDSKQHLCKWIDVESIDDGGVCKYRDQTVSWQVIRVYFLNSLLKTTILISVLVTLLSSIGSLIIDYVFIDVLSAPTADSLKVSTQRARTEATRSQINRRIRNLLEVGASTKNAVGVTMTHKAYLFEDEVRVVSPELIEAHAEAMATAGDVLEDTQERIRRSVEASRSVRLTKIQSRHQEMDNQSLGNITLSGDDLMSALVLEIKEERNKLKKTSEKESFDAVWG